MSDSVLRVIVDEGDQLKIRAVLEDNEFVFRLTAGMATSWYDCKVVCQPFGGTEDGFVWEEDDDVVEIDGGHCRLADKKDVDKSAETRESYYLYEIIYEDEALLNSQ
jgi:hypothetical protein